MKNILIGKKLSDKIFDLSNASTQEELAQKKMLQKEEEHIYKEMEDLRDQSLDLFERIVAKDPNNADVYYYLSHIYLSRSVLLANRQLILEENGQDNRVSEEEIKKLLTQSMEYGEKVVEVDASFKEIWSILSQVYIRLNMNDKATEAMKKSSQ